MRRCLAIVAAVATLPLAVACGADEEQRAPQAAPPTSAAAPDADATSAPTPSTPSAPADVPRPPDASITAGGQTVIAGLGSYCWDDPAGGGGACADSAAPSCDDAFTPHLAVTAGTPVEWLFDLEVVDGPVLTVHAPAADGAGTQTTLPAGATTQWRASLPPGAHAVSLFVRSPPGNDVSYTACLEVTGDGPIASEPTIEAPAGPSAQEAECASRWNSASNASARAAAVGPAVGAVVEATSEGCSVTVMRLANDGGFTAVPFAAVADDRFEAGTPAPADAAGAAMWSVDATGALVARPALAGAPLPATVVTPSNGPARVPWSAYTSAADSTELALGACGDADGPVTLRARAGEPLTVAVPFVPATTPTLVFEDGRSIELPGTPGAEWPIDLGAALHALHVDVRTPDGVDVRYTACLDVSG